MMKFPIYGKLQNVPNHQPVFIVELPNTHLSSIFLGITPSCGEKRKDFWGCLLPYCSRVGKSYYGKVCRNVWWPKCWPRKELFNLRTQIERSESVGWIRWCLLQLSPKPSAEGWLEPEKNANWSPHFLPSPRWNQLLQLIQPLDPPISMAVSTPPT
jgi:hypothetical protein